MYNASTVILYIPSKEGDPCTQLKRLFASVGSHVVIITYQVIHNCHVILIIEEPLINP